MSDVIKFPARTSLNLVEQRVLLVPKSIQYRRRAARLGQLADAEPADDKMLALMHQALSWIQLAENEELLAHVNDRAVVLVVEDKPIQRLDAVSMIEDAGYDTLEAASADAAISILESRAVVDVVFTDIRMAGGMDGLNLAAAVKKRWPSITVVTTSGAFDVPDEQLPPGCLFLPKPYSPKQIIGAIQGLARVG